MPLLVEKLTFGDAKSDNEFVAKATELNNYLLKVNKHLELADSVNVENLGVEERINLKLFTMYTINSLYWIQLRLKGEDPNTHAVKQQLLRIRQLMKKRDDIIDKRKQPTLDKGAAKRFIRNGLWDPKNRDQLGPANKKTKFSDD